MSLVNKKVTFKMNQTNVTGVVLDKFRGVKKIEDHTTGKRVFFVTVDFYYIRTTTGEIICIEPKKLFLTEDV